MQEHIYLSNLHNIQTKLQHGTNPNNLTANEKNLITQFNFDIS